MIIPVCPSAEYTQLCIVSTLSVTDVFRIRTVGEAGLSTPLPSYLPPCTRAAWVGLQQDSQASPG